MIPELGHFALILALSLALCQGILPLVGAHRNDAALMSVARTAAQGQLFFVAFDLQSLRDLPDMEQLQDAGLVARR